MSSRDVNPTIRYILCVFAHIVVAMCVLFSSQSFSCKKWARMESVNLLLYIHTKWQLDLYWESAMLDDWFCRLIDYGGHVCWWDMDMSMAIMYDCIGWIVLIDHICHVLHVLQSDLLCVDKVQSVLDWLNMSLLEICLYVLSCICW